MNLKSLFKKREAPAAPIEDDIRAQTPRNAERIHAYADAVVKTRYGMDKRGVLIDFSETGAHIRFVSVDGLVEGDVITLNVALKQLKRVATVQWTDKTDIGVKFAPLK